MSLNRETMLQQTLKSVSRKIIELMSLTFRLYEAIEDHKGSVRGLSRKMKALAEEINNICEELP